MAEQLFQFVVRQGPVPGETIELVKDVLVIGREDYNDITIAERSLSRQHARLTFRDGAYYIEDMGSTNGTFINGKPIKSAQALRPGDAVALGGKVILAYEAVPVAADATMVLDTGGTMRLDRADILQQLGLGAEANALSEARAEEHRSLFQRWFEELWNRKNYAITQELVDPEFTAHGAGGQDIKQGPDGVAGMVKVWHGAFPDGHMTMDDIITEGDLSVIRMTWRGTHTGDFYGIPPSNKPVEVTSIGIDRVINGKITEGWGELNMLGMMQQMGAFPPPAPAAVPAEAPQPVFAIQAAVTPEHVSEAYAALASGEIDRIRQYWADEMVWQVPGHNRLSGWYTSLDEFLAFMGQVGELSGHSFNMEPVAGKVLVTGDYSVDLTRNRGRRANNPGKTMDIEVAHVLRWKNGKVIAGKGAIFGDGTEEYDQFWSESPVVTPPTP